MNQSREKNVNGMNWTKTSTPRATKTPTAVENFDCGKYPPEKSTVFVPRHHPC